MRTQYYQFAGVKIAISMPEELFYEEEYRLEPFLREETEAAWTFRFEKVEQLDAPEGEPVDRDPSRLIYAGCGFCVRYIGAYGGNWEIAYARAEYREKQVSVQLRAGYFPGRVNVKTILTVLGAEHLVARNHGFLLHCSFIARNGKAILFTAPSETGKSTQAELWREYRGTHIINGDRAAVRLADGVLMAEGIPFAGSSRYCENQSLPIEAIVYLGQAPKTTIRKLRGYEAFARIWEGVSVDTWDREDLELVSHVVQKTAESIPVYHLPCTPDESAVVALEEALRKQVNHDQKK